MSARTVIRDSDDGGSDIEQEHLDQVNEIRGQDAFTEPDAAVHDDAGGGNGWNLPPTMQLMFNDHQPTMMFSEGSSTIPNTTWTQQQIALGARRSASVQAEIDTNVNQSQKSKSSLNWSEHLKSQGLDSLVRSQDEEVECQVEEPFQHHTSGFSHDTDIAIGHASPDRPSLLPIVESHTPPGTPKLLDLSTAFARDSPSKLESGDHVNLAATNGGEVMPPASMLTQSATIDSQPVDSVKRKTLMCEIPVSTNHEDRLDRSSHDNAQALPPNESAHNKRQKRSKSASKVKKHTSPRQDAFVSVDLNSGDGDRLQKPVMTEYMKEEAALFAPDLVHVNDPPLTAPRETRKKSRGRPPQVAERPQVIVQVPTKNEHDMPLDSETEVAALKPKPKKGRGRPKKEQQPNVTEEMPVAESQNDMPETADEAADDAERLDDKNLDATTSIAVPNTKDMPPEEAIVDVSAPLSLQEEVVSLDIASKVMMIKTKTSMSNLKSLTPYRVGLSRRTRIPSLLKVVRK